MELPSNFNAFLRNVRLTKNQTDDCITGHKTLTGRLRSDETLSPHIINIFLQGSYKRSTAVRPKGESRADVDVIVVTDLHEEDYSPQDAVKLFLPFMKKYYTSHDGTPKYRIQGRSIGINLSYVDLDLVVTSAPSESQKQLLEKTLLSDSSTLDTSGEALIKSIVEVEELRAHFNPFGATGTLLERSIKMSKWRDEPLRIPDRDAQEWRDTHPIAQIQWTWEKGKLCNGYYINVVQALKWWRRLNDVPKYPKGYPVEHLIGQHCPDGITSVAQGIVCTLESIASSYSYELSQGIVPNLPDHGVPQHNVLGRLSAQDFKDFHELVRKAAPLARQAYDEQDGIKSSELWHLLLGDKFLRLSSTASSARILTPLASAGLPSGSGPRPLKDNPYF